MRVPDSGLNWTETTVDGFAIRNATCIPDPDPEADYVKQYVYPKERHGNESTGKCARCKPGNEDGLCYHGDWCVDKTLSPWSYLLIDQCHYSPTTKALRGCPCHDDPPILECECCVDDSLHKPCSNSTHSRGNRKCVFKNQTCDDAPRKCVRSCSETICESFLGSGPKGFMPKSQS